MCSRIALANAIRVLSIDAVQKANSGHPGASMGMADIAEVLWRSFLQYNPNNPYWDNRDRVILSNGHASALLYSVLHLTGYDISIDDLQDFRQLHSKTPGHPEVGCTPGIEVTTGPLGQGLACGVGMSIAEKILASYFNRPQYNIVDHYTWIFAGDGCLMEGISHEACSLAGTWKLGKLIVLYDSNKISIDGNTRNWFSDNTEQRFQSYNWHVINNVDGHDSNSIIQAMKIAKSVTDKPSIIIFNTTIGFGSPNKSGTAEVHGAPLGEKEVILTKKKLNWKYPPFYIPDEIYDHWDFRNIGSKLEENWNALFAKYKIDYPDLSAEYTRRMSGLLPVDWSKKLLQIIKNVKHDYPIATRQSSQNILENFGKILPELLGGSADLAPSNLTMWSGSVAIHQKKSGNYIHYGVREFGMTSIANGISQHGGFIPYTATFLVFSDYSKNAIRMSALMGTRQIMLYTHDSIGLGEDGPTHQPVEQLSNLRSIPNMSVWRPSDTSETFVAWKLAIERYQGPTALVLSRQNLEQISRNENQLHNIARGGYVLRNFGNTIDIIFIATGAEVQLAILAASKIYDLGYGVRVVSMPSTDIFDSQDDAYKKSVLPKTIKNRIAIEAGKSDFWYKYVGYSGLIFGIDRFGESAPAGDLFKKFGFTVNNIVCNVKKFLDGTFSSYKIYK
ncbi:transketolase [Buchnera aphidicola]|uniref:Transketolase n=1 Tax=Buchnera aphidicola (Sarucallis kahawaluokalani) TaxID=1241878 RepID=A0A4D6YJ32_9GAMM|nr:transketolase [Buchnera aphidicola]QCI25870.1 transketolase [Buchnera aphidicola (Sarucallis kahawaluokalani)]